MRIIAYRDATAKTSYPQLGTPRMHKKTGPIGEERQSVREAIGKIPKHVVLAFKIRSPTLRRAACALKLFVIIRVPRIHVSQISTLFRGRGKV